MTEADPGATAPCHDSGECPFGRFSRGCRKKRGSEVYNRNKNIITRAIGIGEHVDIDAFEVDLLPETIVLLCTDGLSNMLSDAEIGRILRAHTDPDETVEALIDAANARGGSDNISAVVLMSSGKEAAV